MEAQLEMRLACDLKGPPDPFESSLLQSIDNPPGMSLLACACKPCYISSQVPMYGTVSEYTKSIAIAELL